jgi:aromatic ring-opening dioxygenase catalytic subunit (LigB family)
VAEIIAGLGCSHAPSIAHAYDHKLTREAGWKPLFDAFEQSHRWLMSQSPDVIVVIYNDHVDHYFYDAWPTFSIGIADQFEIPDEGFGPRAFPPVPGHVALARHIATELVEQGFDLAASHRMSLDHGFLSPMPLLDEGWKVPVVPMTINVVVNPLPPPKRCWAMGAAVGKAIQSFPANLRVAIMGTGGLSHQLTGPNCGRVAAEWDRKFMDLIEKTPKKLNSYTMQDFARLGGEHSVEVVQWIAMRAAIPASSKTELRFYYPHGMMGYGILGFRVPPGRAASKRKSNGAKR